MRKLKSVLLLCFATAFSIAVNAQQAVTVSGSVTNSKSKEAVSSVSVTIKSTTLGTFTDDKGKFKITTTQKLPFTLVFASVGYADKEVVVSTNNQNVEVAIDTKFTFGQDVVVAASRVSEKILEFRKGERSLSIKELNTLQQQAKAKFASLQNSIKSGQLNEKNTKEAQNALSTIEEDAIERFTL